MGYHRGGLQYRSLRGHLQFVSRAMLSGAYGFELMTKWSMLSSLLIQCPSFVTTAIVCFQTSFLTHGVFYRFSIQPLTILGVTGPFSVLAENIYSLCIESFHVS